MYCGKHLRLLRVIKNLSQNDIAEKLQLKQQAVSKWESKKHLDHETIDRFLIAADATRKEFEEIRQKFP